MEVCAQMGFARKLASPNKKTREKAISLLALWLGSQKQISEEELKKIWKGLFYCVWHSDKLPVQADLIGRLASLCEKLDIQLALQLFEVFLTTMRREWAGIDRLRMDKFYLLLRKYLAHMFVALRNTGWDKERTKDFMHTLLERAFLAKDQYAALGINLHYADIFLHELESFLPLSPETARLLLQPFLVVYASSSDKSLLERIQECVFESLHFLGRSVIAAKKEGGTALEVKKEALGSLVLGLPLAAEAFKLASLPSTQQSNRKKLYELHEKFEMLEKLLSTSGVCIPVGDADGALPDLRREEPNTKSKKRKASKKLILSDPGRNAQNHLCEGTDIKRDVVGDISLSSREKKKKQKHKQSNKKQHNGGAQDDRSPQAQDEGAPDSANLKRKKKSSEKGMDMKQSSQEIRDAGTGREKRVVTTKEGSQQQRPSTSDPGGFTIDDSVISNLRFQFDLLAAKGYLETDSRGTPIRAASSPTKIGDKKRKRVADRSGSASRVVIGTPLPSDHRGGDGSSPGGKVGNSSGKAKRVRFALKKNLVWQPFSPLPPQSLRVPPSATPRGSALKRGVPPGPIVASVDDMLLKKRKKGTPRRPSIQSSVKSIRSLARVSGSLKKLYGSA